VKILVTVKRVPDPEQKVKFKGTSVDVSAANWVINAFDEYAVETALRLNENAATGEKQGETIVMSIGPKEVSQQLRSALAMGADRAILVGASDEELDSFAVARIVKAVVDKEKPDLLLMGKLATDGEASQVPQIVAPCSTGRRPPSPRRSPPAATASRSSARSTPASRSSRSSCPRWSRSTCASSRPAP